MLAKAKGRGKALAACGVLLLTLDSGLALAQQDTAYRETQLGLYLSAAEAYELLQNDSNAVLIDVRDPVEVKFTGFAELTDIHVPWSLADRSEEHTSELQSRGQLVCRLLLEKKKTGDSCAQLLAEHTIALQSTCNLV